MTATLDRPLLAVRPCLARGDLVHDGPCTCLGARDGAPARFPTPTLGGPR